MRGWWLGRHDTPVPSFIVRVTASAWAMNRSGHGMFSQTDVKCSPIQASSKPSGSRVTSCSRSSAMVWDGFDGDVSGMVK
jgi:hypothetical protein